MEDVKALMHVPAYCSRRPDSKFRSAAGAMGDTQLLGALLG